MKIRYHIVCFLSVSSCLGMQSQDVEQYQFASKMAQAALPDEFFDFIKQYKLDLNKPFDEEGNTLMHSIAACEDTAYSQVMRYKAQQMYKGDLFVKNNKGQNPQEVAYLLGNKYNAYKMIPYVCSLRYRKNNYKLFMNDQNEANLYKKNQDDLHRSISKFLNAETNDSNTLSVRFCNDSVEKLASVGKKYLFINDKRFKKLLCDAQKALLIQQLELHKNNAAEITQGIYNCDDLKKDIGWNFVYRADEVAASKYPKGMLALLEFISSSPDLNASESLTHPSIKDRLVHVKTALAGNLEQITDIL